ncbi:MAG: hypothetical protein FJZ95_02040 [Chloroflexi bacterium]|nr:hypothetical protein [Chloroflexota bacterium]
MAQLSLKGYIALPTTRNLKSVDVVVFNEKLSQFAFIQVKSTDKPKSGWPVHTVRKEEEWAQDVRKALDLGERFFYVFVALPNRNQQEPVYYVVPSRDAADMVVADLEKWLSTHPNSGAARQLLAWGYSGLPPHTINKYQNKWELLMPEDQNR